MQHDEEKKMKKYIEWYINNEFFLPGYRYTSVTQVYRSKGNTNGIVGRSCGEHIIVCFSQ